MKNKYLTVNLSNDDCVVIRPKHIKFAQFNGLAGNRRVREIRTKTTYIDGARITNQHEVTKVLEEHFWGK